MSRIMCCIICCTIFRKYMLHIRKYMLHKMWHSMPNFMPLCQHPFTLSIYSVHIKGTTIIEKCPWFTWTSTFPKWPQKSDSNGVKFDFSTKFKITSKRLSVIMTGGSPSTNPILRPIFNMVRRILLVVRCCCCIMSSTGHGSGW